MFELYSANNHKSQRFWKITTRISNILDNQTLLKILILHEIFLANLLKKLQEKTFFYYFF